MAMRLDGVARIDGADTESVGSCAVAENPLWLGPTKPHHAITYGMWVIIPSSLLLDENKSLIFLLNPRDRSAFNHDPVQLRLIHRYDSQNPEIVIGYSLTMNVSTGGLGGSPVYYAVEVFGTDQFTDLITLAAKVLVWGRIDYGSDPSPATWIAPPTVTVGIGATTWTLVRQGTGELPDPPSPAHFIDAAFPLVIGGLAGTELHGSYAEIDQRFLVGDVQGAFETPNDPSAGDLTLLAAGVSPADAQLRDLFPLRVADYWPLMHPGNMGVNLLDGPSGAMTLQGNAAFAPNFAGVEPMAEYASQPDSTTGIDAGLRLDTGAALGANAQTLNIGHSTQFRRMFMVFDLWEDGEVAAGATASNFILSLNEIGIIGATASFRIGIMNANADAITEASTVANIGALHATLVSFTTAGDDFQHDINVDALVQIAHTAGWRYLCFVVYRLDETTEDDLFWIFGAAENATASLRPALAGTVTPPLTAPDAPTLDTATSPSALRLRIQATAPASDGGAPILEYKVRDGDGGTLLGTIPVDAIGDHTLTVAAGTYDVVVHAVNAIGEGDASNVVEVTVTLPAACIPTPNGATALSSTGGNKAMLRTQCSESLILEIQDGGGGEIVGGLTARFGEVDEVQVTFNSEVQTTLGELRAHLISEFAASPLALAVTIDLYSPYDSATLTNLLAPQDQEGEEIMVVSSEECSLIGWESNVTTMRRQRRFRRSFSQYGGRV